MPSTYLGLISIFSPAIPEPVGSKFKSIFLLPSKIGVGIGLEARICCVSRLWAKLGYLKARV